MGGFLYFIPAAVTRSEQLAAYDLSYAFERGAAGFACCPCRAGPGGAAGTVVGDDRGGRVVGYYPEKQTWRKVQTEPAESPPVKGGGVHVGYYTDAAPTPEDLIRRDALNGHAVRLGDGNEWIIPVARGAAEESGELRYFAKVPRRLDLDDSGAWVSGGIVPRYAELWGVACAFWNAFTGAGVEKTGDGVAVRMEFADLVDGAVTALGSNYRVRSTEAALLGLLDEENCGAMLRALIDWPTVEAFLQKKTQGTESAGAPAG